MRFMDHFSDVCLHRVESGFPVVESGGGNELLFLQLNCLSLPTISCSLEVVLKLGPWIVTPPTGARSLRQKRLDQAKADSSSRSDHSFFLRLILVELHSSSSTSWNVASLSNFLWKLSLRRVARLNFLEGFSFEFSQPFPDTWDNKRIVECSVIRDREFAIPTLQPDSL
ncbi:hypothetical protein Tco_0410073 [Tanacetum coccineum]